LEKSRLGSKEKEGLKNESAESDLRAIKDSIAKLLGFVSTTS